MKASDLKVVDAASVGGRPHHGPHLFTVGDQLAGDV